LRVIITRTPASSRGKETPSRLRVSKDQATTEAPSELGALDAIAREGARRMLMMAIPQTMNSETYILYRSRSENYPRSSVMGAFGSWIAF
jgi:hypothetical protein